MVVIDPLGKVEELGEEALEAVEEFGEDIIYGFQRLTKLYFPVKQSSQPLKRSLTGYETEMFVLKADGSVDHSGRLLNLGKRKKLPVEPEAAKGIIEALCLPHQQHQHTSKRLVANLRQLSELAEKNDLVLYPFGTYPGKQNPVIQDKEWYRMLSRVLGEDRFRNSAGGCCGYHQHYTLPRGMFDPKTKKLRYSTSGKVKRTLLDSYNFLTAADPVFTCLLQSSPFVQGRYVAKDSRLLLYRGGRPLMYTGGKFSRPDMYVLGELSPYETTLHDLMHTIEHRRNKWVELMVEKNIQPNHLLKNPLDFTWNPLKINPHGTLEYRGPDMNFLSNIFGVSTMIKFSLRRIQQDFALVTPIDIEMKDAFKIEGNLLFIPPHSKVRTDLQHASAYEGLGNRELRTYMKRLYRFARSEIARYDNAYLPLLRPVTKMLNDRKTVSDRMVADARRLGDKHHLTKEAAREIALTYAERWKKDLIRTEELLRKANAESVE